MRLVAALGGNALLRRGDALDVEIQRHNVERAAAAIAALARRHRVIVTHGNGPQVGLLALQAESVPGVAPYPLDVLGAESEGMIGYFLEQSLRRALPGRDVATLLTQVEVDPRDPAFAKPTKPIGPVYDAARGRALAAERGWQLASEPGGGVRRVVASPEPKRVLELHTIELLVDAGVLVVCTGGGGVPVVAERGLGYRGVEAVIDKDRASALLALELGAEALLLLTDVAAVYEDWPEPARRALGRVTPERLRELRLDPGSMGPKVDAACRFVEGGGGVAAIGAMQDAPALLAGTRGTQVVLDAAASEPEVSGA